MDRFAAMVSRCVRMGRLSFLWGLLCLPLAGFAATSASVYSFCGITISCSISSNTLTCSNDSHGNSPYCAANWKMSATDTSHLITGNFLSVAFTSGATGVPSGQFHVCASSALGLVRECWLVSSGDVYLYYIGKDPDNDSRGSTADNCPDAANSDQANNDGDSQGDVCDTDDDNDGVPDYLDPEPLNAANSSVWPLSGNYRGTLLRENTAVQ